MIGKIFITRTGYDPQLGKHIKDPTLDQVPTLGACRPNVRENLQKGDHVFVVSGKVRQANQFIIGGFEIETKIDATEAYKQFPQFRLRKRFDGQLTGNIIVDSQGVQHSLDDHDPMSFEKRKLNYIVGTNLISLESDEEIRRGRQETLGILRTIFHNKGNSPFEIIGRGARLLDEKQIYELRDWFKSLKLPIN